MWLQTVKSIAKKLKCAPLAQEIRFSAPNSCGLPWLVKGATRLCTYKKECNKLDLTAAQYFWLVDHNDWSRCFAISSPHTYEVPVLLLRLPKKTAKLKHFNFIIQSDILSTGGDALIPCCKAINLHLIWFRRVLFSSWFWKEPLVCFIYLWYKF
jgi:hypothetical protein